MRSVSKKKALLQLGKNLVLCGERTGVLLVDF